MNENELTIYCDPGEAPAGEIASAACERSLTLIRDLWGLPPPGECRVYVTASWQRVLFHPAPWPWRVYLVIALPLLFRRIQRVWDMAGGWALRYGRRWVIGVKPPRLLREVDPAQRERVFRGRDAEEWLAHNVCHELVHACSDHLRLPTWLHEGLAMVTVDRLAGRPTVKAETLAMLVDGSQDNRPLSGRSRVLLEPDRAVHLAVRGYWVTRYLAETRPALLREQLVRRQLPEALEGALAAGLGTERERFWSEIEREAASRFRGS